MKRDRDRPLVTVRASSARSGYVPSSKIRESTVWTCAQSAYEEFAKSAVPDPQKLALLIEGGRLDGALVAPAHDDQEIKAEMSQAQQRLTELKERSKKIAAQQQRIMQKKAK